MIQTFSYTMEVSDGDVDAAAVKIASKLERVAADYRKLLNAHVEIHDDNILIIRLRIDGHTRWHNAGDARSIISSTARRAGIPVDRLRLETVEIETTARYLTNDEGRTPRAAKPHGSHKRRRPPVG